MNRFALNEPNITALLNISGLTDIGPLLLTVRAYKTIISMHSWPGPNDHTIRRILWEKR